ncbi:hypothetical protein pEaSNUABM5_00203 [Erwinia phage pEa_SNUABM_5]|uniref:Uncharacterized protein n=1 Tax=Erwinia phage pEa_SNUABM_5 TaxID=2797313 RepID=A0A7T8IVQ0_9CAUD|nr:hypothetical protein MPK73_gp203 [Erwinia phage pEa_SNUABM_5]QQO90345.1 hypothetical protein pEaSNUABM5_00203 [Erwinia phage pEa_SNUABM_5]
MIVYKTFDEIKQDLLPYKYHRVVDDFRMIQEVAITPNVWQRLKYYLMGEQVPRTSIVPREDVRITHTCLYAHPEIAAALRLRLLVISSEENPFKDK